MTWPQELPPLHRGASWARSAGTLVGALAAAGARLLHRGLQAVLEPWAGVVRGLGHGGAQGQEAADHVPQVLALGQVRRREDVLVADAEVAACPKEARDVGDPLVGLHVAAEDADDPTRPHGIYEVAEGLARLQRDVQRALALRRRLRLRVPRDRVDPAGDQALVLLQAHQLLRLAAPVQQLGWLALALHRGALLLLLHHGEPGLHGAGAPVPGGLEAVRDALHPDALLLLDLPRVLRSGLALVGDDLVHFRTPAQPAS
mmetsp:Transcript_73153/g.214371  ORF Transcript_73153/g.214371 Transcript_73153/m.214371 type:complete len:259 (-) Transcript_73153:747-1523(-)